MIPVSSLLYLMSFFVRYTVSNIEQSTFSIVRGQSLVDVGNKLWDGLVRSKIACSSRCLQDTKCLSGHFHPVSKRCSLYSSDCLVSNSAEDGIILVKKVDLEDCSGKSGSGVVDIQGVGCVYCENTKHGGGWTVFQRRFDGSVDFYRNWESYTHGFGDMNGEFWLGLVKLHKLLSSGNYMLRVDLEDFENNTAHAIYTSFRIGDESTGYRLDIGGFSGDAGDSLSHHNGMKFSTYDRDNDIDNRTACAVVFKGAWWYIDCYYSNLNGLYQEGNSYIGMHWYSWKGWYYSVKSSVMMIRLL